MEGSSNQTVITNLYYPGYSQKHRFTHTAFIEELDDLLETELCNYDNLLVGDFNKHSDDSTLDETVKLYNIMSERGLHILNWCYA